MKEQIIKILESYIVDNIGETSPKIDIDAIPAIADEIFALQLQQTGVSDSDLHDKIIKQIPDAYKEQISKTIKKHYR